MSKRYQAYEEEVRTVIGVVSNWTQALLELGRPSRVRADRALKNFVAKHNIDTSHNLAKVVRK